MTFMGYDIDSANELGVSMFGEMWCLQNVIDELDYLWDQAKKEAKIGTTCSSKRISRENKCYVLREFCMMIDKESGLSTQWYDWHRNHQDITLREIDDIWEEARIEEEMLLQDAVA